MPPHQRVGQSCRVTRVVAPERMVDARAAEVWVFREKGIRQRPRRAHRESRSKSVRHGERCVLLQEIEICLKVFRRVESPGEIGLDKLVDVGTVHVETWIVLAGHHLFRRLRAGKDVHRHVRTTEPGHLPY